MKTEQDLLLAKRNEAYHRKQMEYFQEEIELIEKDITKNAIRR